MKQEFKEELILKVKAGVPVIQIISYEWRRVLGFSLITAKECNKQLYLWDNVSGLRKWDFTENEQRDENASLKEPSELLNWFRETASNDSILLIEDLHIYFDAPQFRQILGGLRYFSKSGTSKTIFLSQPVRRLPPELEKDVYVMDIPLPNKNILRSVIKEVIDELKMDKNDAPEKELDVLSESALGLTTSEAKHTFKEIAIDRKKLTKKEIPLVIKQKEQIIKKNGILEYFHPDKSLADVGGMERLKDWLKKRRAGFEPDAEGFGMTAPKGVLLLGVQGCGKSLIAKAISSEWNLPLLKFDLGRVFGGIVGESEGNIRRALDIAQAIAPSILWIDEIEKGLSGVSSSDRTDGGTTSRVFGTMLTWMQEKKDPVFVIATANKIEQLPPELLRKGRFDEIFFVDLPGMSSRKDIWNIHLRKRLGDIRFKDKNFDINELSKMSRSYSGAEIEEAINEGLYQAYYKKRDLQMDDLKESLDKTVPLSKIMGESIKSLRDWAKVRAQLASDEEVESIDVDTSIPRLKNETFKPIFE